MKINAKQFLDAVGKNVAAHRLAGFGTTELEDMPACRMVAIVMIEGHHTMDFGAGKIERAGNQRQRILRHIAELLLDPVQDREKRAFHRFHAVDNGGCSRCYVVRSDLHIHIKQPSRGSR
jgi:hypothetical protein